LTRNDNIGVNGRQEVESDLCYEEIAGGNLEESEE
jgi:hypothetical protein